MHQVFAFSVDNCVNLMNLKLRHGHHFLFESMKIEKNAAPPTRDKQKYVSENHGLLD
jgi:hypothetical protein